MLNVQHLKNFKPWKDTRKIELAPMSVFFGENSSGKTSLLQSLLLLKQTVEAHSQEPLLLGGWGGKSLIDLGTAENIFYKGAKTSDTLSIGIEWGKMVNDALQNIKWLNLLFNVEILFKNNTLSVKSLKYANADNESEFIEALRITEGRNDGKYELRTGSNIDLTERRKTAGQPWPLPRLVSCYSFPSELDRDYVYSDAIREIEYSFTNLIRSFRYIGPLRLWPSRTYTYANVMPESVGDKGADAVTMLVGEMNAKTFNPKTHLKNNKIKQVGEALKRLGVITEFEIEPIGGVGRLYELKVRVSKFSPFVSIVDVGFGVSQVLPIIVESVFAGAGSVLLLEQPELHLHPKVQSNLAKVLLDFVKEKSIQYIIESHSEHFLTRLQSEMAADSDAINRVKIYFCEQAKGESKIRRLETDEFGYIKDWPEDFFGDVLGERMKMADARARRIVEEGMGDKK
ncbi:MAG: DUF3696 domain-containing protein [Desulfosporosinus sp.]